MKISVQFDEDERITVGELFQIINSFDKHTEVEVTDINKKSKGTAGLKNSKEFWETE